MRIGPIVMHCFEILTLVFDDPNELRPRIRVRNDGWRDEEKAGEWRYVKR